MFHFVTYTSNKRSEHPLCSILKIILLTRHLNTFCVPIWPEHPFLIFYYENLPFDASFFHPDTLNTQNTPEHPKSPSIEHLLCSDDTRTPFVFHFETYTSSMRSEHPLCSILKIILLTRHLNTFCVLTWPAHPFLIFYNENLPFDASFFQPDTLNETAAVSHKNLPILSRYPPQPVSSLVANEIFMFGNLFFQKLLLEIPRPLFLKLQK